MWKRPYTWLLLLPVALGLFLGGCRTLNLAGFGTDGDKSPDKPTDPKGPQHAQDHTPVPFGRPGKYSLRIAPYVFHSDFELKRDHALFKELASLRDQVHKELQLPMSSNSIDVYLFEDKELYEKYMAHHYPTLPNRRAFFVAQPRGMGAQEELMVFTSWGKLIQQDLRHELTHALLHSVLKDVPLWLDEGLAEYFELPPDKQGVNATHLAQLTGGAAVFKPNLAKLESLTEVKDMNPAEYRESWAWVHLMLRGDPRNKKVLLAYLQQLRANPKPGALRPRLAAVVDPLDDALTAHLKHLEPAQAAPMASVGGR